MMRVRFFLPEIFFSLAEIHYYFFFYDITYTGLYTPYRLLSRYFDISVGDDHGRSYYNTSAGASKHGGRRTTHRYCRRVRVVLLPRARKRRRKRSRKRSSAEAVGRGCGRYCCVYGGRLKRKRHCEKRGKKPKRKNYDNNVRKRRAVLREREIDGRGDGGEQELSATGRSCALRG